MNQPANTLQGFEYWYPANNRIDVPVEWVPDRLHVHNVQEQRIIEIGEFMSQPMARYGCTLLSGVDSLSQPRTIYLEALSDRDLPRLRLVLVDSDYSDPEPISEPFEQTPDDRKLMLEIAAEFFIPYGLTLAVELV